MAKQDINLGTQPTGVGGDTNRSANIKTNANLKEIYTALGGSVSGGNGSVLPNSLPISKGGTGATTVAAARTNLGLGTAAVANIGNTPGDVVPSQAENVNDFLALESRRSGFFQVGGSNAVNYPISEPNMNYAAILQVYRTTPAGICIFANASINPRLVAYCIISGTLRESKIYTDSNTTKDANGFIKAASPIVELYSDRIELNDEAKQQAITFEKLGVGDYLIKGSSGLAQSGWYVEQPKDANGNVYHAVVYNTLDNGDISIKTYEQKMDGVKIVADLDKPVDVKENRFISIRLQELPQEPIEEPQPDPTITDYQGNPAPSRLHELVDGTWTISGENAAILENERLSAMPALTRRQFRLALVLNGYNLADIETLINSIEDPMQRQITMIEWQDATTFHRTNPSLIVMAGLMGLDAETVDQLWLQASTL